MVYDAVIFDLDGTLLNTIDDLCASGNRSLAALGLPTHTVEHYKRMVGSGVPALVERMLPAGRQNEALHAAVLSLFLADYAQHKEDATAPYPGIVELLGALRAAGVKTGVVSNKEDALTKDVIAHYFPGQFDCVAGHILGTPAKPDPTRVNEMRAAFGLSAARVLYVGDSDVDITTAHNAGLDSCGVLWGFRSEAELRGAGALYLAAQPADLLQLVRGQERF